MRRGQEACRIKRALITKKIKDQAKKEIGKISKRDLWILGVALHWAEGSKGKKEGINVVFCNSNPQMIKLFLKWLQQICKIPKKDIVLSIYLHETAVERAEEIRKYWLEVTNFPSAKFQKIVWKKNKINTKRKNIGENYHGLLRIVVKKSVNLNRKIAGWIEGIYKNCGVV